MNTSNKKNFKQKFLFLLLYLVLVILYMYIFISILLKSETVHASRYPNYSVCFTPNQNCTDFIVQEIVHAKESIFVQAYGFSSRKIITALVTAKKRGVKIEIILDRSNFHQNKKYILDFLQEYNIEFYQDKVAGIAHNKIMIIDKKKVLTGSFNFTDAAEKRNSENIILLTDFNIAELYLKNWNARKMHALNTISITKK